PFVPPVLDQDDAAFVQQHAIDGYRVAEGRPVVRRHAIRVARTVGAPKRRRAGAPRVRVSFRRLVRWGAVLILAAGVVAAACGNDPYPGTDAGRKVVYLAFDSPPKLLDPQVAYTTTDHVVTGAVHDRLLEYDYLARPYRLI